MYWRLKSHFVFFFLYYSICKKVFSIVFMLYAVQLNRMEISWYSHCWDLIAILLKTNFLFMASLLFNIRISPSWTLHSLDSASIPVPLLLFFSSITRIDKTKIFLLVSCGWLLRWWLFNSIGWLLVDNWKLWWAKNALSFSHLQSEISCSRQTTLLVLISSVVYHSSWNLSSTLFSTVCSLT